MSFNLSLFEFQNQTPFKTLSNKKQLYHIYPLNNPNQLYCLKIAHILSESDLTTLQNEVNLHAMSSHPQILSFKGFQINENKDQFGLTSRKFFILTEYFNSNLSDIIQLRANTQLNFTNEEITIFLQNSINALNHLQKQSIAHRNINSENFFLIDNNWKLANFDISINAIGLTSTIMRSFQSNAKYYEPLIINALSNGLSELDYNIYKNDVYCLGIVLLEMIYLENITNIKKEIKSGKLKEKINNLSYKIDDKISNIIKSMLNDDFTKRPDFFTLFSRIYNNNSIQLDINILGNSQKSLEVSIIQENNENINDSINERESEENKQQLFISNNNPNSIFFGNDRGSEIIFSKNLNFKSEFKQKTQFDDFYNAINLLQLNFIELKHLYIDKKIINGIEIKNLFNCSIDKKTNLFVEIKKKLKIEQLLLFLRSKELININKNNYLMKLEFYSLSLIDENEGDLYLIYKRKKSDLKTAIINSHLSLLEKFNIAKQLFKALEEINNYYNINDLIFNEDYNSLNISNILLDNKNNVFIFDFINNSIENNFKDIALVLSQLLFNFNDFENLENYLYEKINGDIIWKEMIAKLIKNILFFENNINNILYELDNIENFIKFPLMTRDPSIESKSKGNLRVYSKDNLPKLTSQSSARNNFNNKMKMNKVNSANNFNCGKHFKAGKKENHLDRNSINSLQGLQGLQINLFAKKL